MEGRGREASKPVGNRFLAIFRRSATIASFQLLDSGRFLSGIKMENARLISKLARSFGSFLRDVRGK